MKDGKNIETEKKYLIKMPSDAFVEALPAEDVSRISQTYLLSEEGVTARVRKRIFSDRVSYTKTLKMRISDMSAFEDEREISEDEYLEEIKNADPKRQTVEKTRALIRCSGHTFEIDIYPFWQSQAVMEVELLSEDEKFTLPPEIEIIRDVTADKRYKNASLACGDYPEE